MHERDDHLAFASLWLAVLGELRLDFETAEGLVVRPDL
jgi:hypothetical protein